MNKVFVDRYMKSKSKLEAVFRKEHPTTYLDIVKAVINILNDGYGSPSSDRIVEIDHGEYQGTLVYVIGTEGYQPNEYWYVKIWYGSCSGCDTLESIHQYAHKSPTESQIKDYMTLALHVVQGLKKMDDITI